jgi:carboxyl-terminal processing protease
MVSEATKALAEATWDKYTVYFPPVDNKDFNEGLNWEYEWIGAYVDMEKPWKFKIVSPLPDSPAEDAWLKWWDIVTHVNKEEITEKQSIKEIVSLIKWKTWTTVLLTIKRWSEIFDVKVKRTHITIKEVEAKKLNRSTYYIQMKFFWPTIAEEFEKSLELLKTDKSIKKIIFDLRWNGWGYLDQVSYILWSFVPKWEKTAVVKYYKSSQNYYSKWYDDIDFSNYKLIVLENGWTASASEIFIGTLKDYFPKTTVIWEKSYGKGSVQTIKTYKDGSSLKYTIAKWYTWKTETGIDWIWINPDIEIKMETYWVDEVDDKQLQKAIRLR